MRILAISHLFPHVANSHHGIFAARQFTMMKELGAEVTVVFPTVIVPNFFQYIIKNWKDYDAKHTPLNYRGLEVIKVPYVRLTKGLWSCRWEGMTLFNALRKRVIELHRENPFDVIYGRGLFPCADTAVRLSDILNIPAVGVAIGGDINFVPHYSSGMYKHTVKLLGKLDDIMANGSGAASKVKEICGRDCQMAHGVVDLVEFCPSEDKAANRKEFGISPESTVILYVGYMKKAKGIYELIKTFVAIKKKYPNVILKMCGKGTEMADLKRVIDQSEVSDAIEVVGPVAPDKINRWMKSCDLFILPSYSEGMPNVVMEAMASGLPIITTAVGGLPDAVGDCEGAILVQPKSVDQLVQALDSVLADNNKIKSMGIASREVAEKRFGAKMNCKQLLDHLETVIAQYEKKRSNSFSFYAWEKN